MSEDERPARSTWALIQDFWAQFHRMWGLNKDGRYDKRSWSDLQATVTRLLERCGLERRKVPREPRDPEGKP